MNCEQPEFSFKERAKKGTAREADPARLEELLQILSDCRDRDGKQRWMVRRELEAHGFDERELRILSEADERIFSYPGSPGYKHFDNVTDAEFDKCQALKNQGRKMIAKWLRYQRRWHSRHRQTSVAS